jgi:4-hydroxy-3-methylbut-2-en-1-yl diphosphate reductase
MDEPMNRPAVREFVAPGTQVPPGELLIPTEVGDPVQGSVPCPSALLVGGSLLRKGKQVGYAPVGHCVDPSDDEGGAAVFAATCLQRDGSTAAVAAAASPVDRVAVAAARAAVDEWSAVFGTRRLLVAASPWCDGARQALRAVRRAVADHGTVHVCGELAGDAETISELAEQGAIFAESLDQVPDGAIVVFPAHGARPETHAEAADRGLKVIDATCPLVARVHAEARKFAERGDELVLLGQPDHAAVAGIAGQAPEKTTVVSISTPASTAMLHVADARRLSYLLQPGIPVEDFAPVTAALRSRFPAVHGPHPDGFCYAASDRAETIRVIASASDVMLVLGCADSPDSKQISGLARARGTRTHVIAEPSDITPAMLSGASAIGLAESTSAHPALAERVTGALSGLGPLSLTSRRVSTDIVGVPTA